ncbi:helix-turn-helix domain-containing protein [Streptomyces sp. NPDC005708]|uniref:TetR/AcrR family transcriptional regulator n=1 Tax=Streptomyces sp. NPDC005708 TaxID=3154564 RepID=UPI00340B2066
MTTRTRRRPALERVLAAADRLFYESGLHATGVDLISAEAGVSKASLYTYFQTKDDLIAEYLRRRSTQWQEHVHRELMAGAKSARARILTVFDLLGEWFTEPNYRGCPFNNAEAECAPDSPAHQVNLDHRAWVHQLFRDLLAEAGVSDSDRVATQLQLLYDGAMNNALAEPDVAWAQAAKTTAGAVIAAELARA